MKSLLDLTGDATEGQVASPVAKQATTQDLLADIFGSSDAPVASTSSPPAAQQKSSVDDILGLFGSTSISNGATSPAPATPVSPTGGNSLFAGSPPPAAAAAPAAPAQPQAHPAYDANGLRITLAAKKDPRNPNIVNMLARFTATGGVPVDAVNFQAAVPKVSFHGTFA